MLSFIQVFEEGILKINRSKESCPRYIDLRAQFRCLWSTQRETIGP